MKQTILVFAILVAYAFPMNPGMAGGGLKGALSARIEALFDGEQREPGEAPAPRFCDFEAESGALLWQGGLFLDADGQMRSAGFRVFLPKPAWLPEGA